MNFPAGTQHNAGFKRQSQRHFSVWFIYNFSMALHRTLIFSKILFYFCLVECQNNNLQQYIDTECN